MNWLSIANQLEMDLFWTGTGLSIIWRRPGCGDLPPDWDGLALGRHRIVDGLMSYWQWTGIRLARDWLERLWSGSIDDALVQTRAVSLALNRPLLRLEACPYSTLVPRPSAQVASDW